MKNIEVEVRGLVRGGEHRQLIAKLQAGGKQIGTRSRVLIDYSYFLPDGDIQKRTRDIRLRISNGVPEIIVKVGSWGGKEQRQEYSIMCENEEFNKLVETFAVLGFRRGAMCFRRSKIYNFKGSEFVIVEVPNHSRYFEAEILVEKESETTLAQKKLQSICADLGLRIFNDKEFVEYVEILNNESNQVFDFDKDWNENFFIDKYGKEAFVKASKLRSLEPEPLHRFPE